jgi:8-oxo-dGTP pyrophosphatase MutT (NUDIX family)
MNNKQIKRVPVSGAIIVKNTGTGPKILLIRRSKTDTWGMIWEYPRGKCDKGDKTIIECLKREVKEETSLDVDVIKYLGKYSYIADQGTRISTQYNFLCKVKDLNQKVKLSFEHDGFKWISTEGEAELLVPSEMKKMISKIFDSLSVYDNIIEDKIKESLQL